jgi:uncharacterized membrane protein
MEEITYCNINKAEIDKRKKVLIMALVLYLTSTVLVLLQPRQIMWYIAFFASLFLAFVNYYQVTQKFCIKFAVKGIESKRESDEVTKMNDSEKKRLYRMHGLKILLKSFLYAIAVTLLTFSVLYY